MKGNRPNMWSKTVLCAGALGVALCVTGYAVAAEPQSEPTIAAKPVLDDRYPERRTAFHNGVTGYADVTYSVLRGFRPLTLDLYVPASTAAGSRPVIVYVHGGGWMSGHTRHSGAFQNWPEVLASIAARGYVVASLNYRLSGEAQFPAAVHDVKTALRWLREHAVRFNLDPGRVGIWGGSAGGQLAALVGTSCGVAALEPKTADAAVPTQADCAQAVVTWYGVFDFEPLVRGGDATNPASAYLGCTNKHCSDQAIALASPVRHVDRNDPPFLLIHGALDKTVLVGQSEKFHEALLAKGAQSRLLVLPDVDHSFVGATIQQTRTASLRALHATMDFFDAMLGARR